MPNALAYHALIGYLRNLKALVDPRRMITA
jgi:hypothetical protein